MIQCVKLMLTIFEFGVLLFDCFVNQQNVTCLKCSTTYRHYAGEVENIIKGRLAAVSLIVVPKVRSKMLC